MKKKAPIIKKLWHKWPAYLSRYPISTVASFFGISEKSARRYRKEKRIPKNLVPALKSIRKISLPTIKRVREILKLSPELIADLADVSVRQAKQWIKNKTIPIDYRYFLIDINKIEDKKLETPIISFKESKNYLFYSYVWQIHQKLSDTLIIELVKLVEEIVLIKQAKAQVKVIFQAELNFEDDILKYMLISYEFNTKDKIINALLEIYTPLYSNSSDLAKATKKILLEIINRDSTVNTLTLFYRAKKSW